jgi:transposase
MKIAAGYILIKESDYKHLVETIALLDARVKELEGQKNKDSHNSHIPPSKGLVKIKNSRQSTGNKPGGQVGHRGTTLEMVSIPDKIEIYKVASCKNCGLDLSKQPVEGYEKRQEFDFPPIKVEVTEHQAELKICTCGCRNKANFPERITGPVQYGLNIQSTCINFSNYQFMSYDRISEFMEDLTGYKINESTIIKQNERLYNKLETFEEHTKEYIKNSAVSHHDESGIYCEGDRKWLHSSSTKEVTHYGVDDQRGKDATDRIGILPEKEGTIVHDNWATYFKYENCEHGLCNAHHLRELTWFEEEENAQWASDMKDVLLDAKKQVEGAQLEGKKELPKEKIIAIEKRYDKIIKKGIKTIPLPNIQIKKRGKPKKPKQLNFLERFVKHKNDILAFAKNFNIPFDNNLAERDIRMVKVKQKVSGTFRSLNGAKYFARTRSYISTIKKNGRNVFEEIKNALRGCPYIYTT